MATTPKLCEICGVPAQYSYFGVVSCSSCKMFFKRNGLMGQTAVKCIFNNQCEININNRHVCTACRLIKCFKAGMSTELFRSPQNKKKRKIDQPIDTTTTLVKIVEQQPPPSLLPTMNLLQSDNSLLNSDQWTLLANLIHSFNENNLSLIIQRMINEQNDQQLTQIRDQTFLEDFCTTLSRTTQLFISSNRDLCNLSSDKRSVYLRDVADSVTCFGGAFALFQSQSIIDKHLWNIFETRYGSTVITLTRRIILLIDPDVILAKMSLHLIAFSKNTFIYSSNSAIDYFDGNEILKIQNMYAELTWKYLLYKYGNYQAVMRFVNIIQCLMVTIVAMSHVQNIPIHVNHIESLVENIQLTLIEDEIEQMNENIN